MKVYFGTDNHTIVYDGKVIENAPIVNQMLWVYGEQEVPSDVYEYKEEYGNIVNKWFVFDEVNGVVTNAHFLKYEPYLETETI